MVELAVALLISRLCRRVEPDRLATVDRTIPVANVAQSELKLSRESLIQQLANMEFTDRLKAAMKGSREMRAILIRDPNKMVAAAAE